MSSAMGWQIAGSAAALLVAALVAITGWRQREKIRLLTDALDYMTQGLCMFDASARIVLCNRQYLRMYDLSPAIVKPGCTLRRLIEHRKATGLLQLDPEQYCREIMESIAGGRTTKWMIEASDGRSVHAINEPMPGGGWVSTHEDVTEQSRLRQERDAMAVQQKRRAAIEAVIAAFRREIEPLLKTFGDSATAMQSTATALSSASDHTSLCAEGAVVASNTATGGVDAAAESTNELSSSIAEIARRITQTNALVHLAAEEAQATSGQMTVLADSAQKIGSIVKLIQTIAGQTNLLALNATIEAVRAGESGRGFAVVANEVKTLSVETAKAAEAIIGQILGVQDSTASAVESIRRITERMREVQLYASGVAVSIEEQSAATSSISRNVANAAKATQTMGEVLSNVAGAAAQTRMSAQVVLSTSQSVETAAADLRRHIENFLAGVAA
jgi:methyl-accepting chemotaxis protein